MSSPLIVLTNDDGIKSPGLRTLARALAGCGELLIVAPHEQQTSMGRSFHGRGQNRPVAYSLGGRRVRAFDVEASPAVAVRHAVLLLADREPALVISGINYGENIGNGVTISGTVGAAIEAASLGVPAIAASVQTELKYHRTHARGIDFSAAAEFTRRMAKRVIEHGLPKGADLLNINVPDDATADTPWRWTHISRISYFRSTVAETRSGKRFTGYELNRDRELVESDSDVQALLYDRVISVSPMTIDMTARVGQRVLERWAT